MGHHNKSIHMATFLLLIAGGFNWLLVGLFNFNVVDMLGDQLARLVYILVGASAVYEFATHKGSCKLCNTGGEKSQQSHPDQHKEQGM